MFNPSCYGAKLVSDPSSNSMLGLAAFQLHRLFRRHHDNRDTADQGQPPQVPDSVEYFGASPLVVGTVAFSPQTVASHLILTIPHLSKWLKLNS
jgi:hypothetical protein